MILSIQKRDAANKSLMRKTEFQSPFLFKLEGYIRHKISFIFRKNFEIVKLTENWLKKHGEKSIADVLKD